MKIPKVILELADRLKEEGIDYRIGGGQAAVYYGLRDRAGDWDIAIEKITPEVKKVMEEQGFVEIPDTKGLSWEGPVLVDFIVADGRFYPTLDELGLRIAGGLRFVARSMMGYINWKDGKSAYQHLKRYREAIEELELPEKVRERTDLSKFRELVSTIECLRSVVALQRPMTLEKKNLVGFILNKDGKLDNVVDLYQMNRKTLVKKLKDFKYLPIKIVIADVDAHNILMIESSDNPLKLTKPFQVPRYRGMLLRRGYDSVYWLKYNVFQALTPSILSNVRIYEPSKLPSIDKEEEKTELEKVKREIETETYTKSDGDKKMSVIKVEKFARENPLPGGYGDELNINDVDSEQLERGIEVEMEHIGENPELTEEEEEAIAADISYDHLEEIEDYYDWLDWMENLAKSEKAATLSVGSRLVRMASKLDDSGFELQAALLDRLVKEQKIIVANPAILDSQNVNFKEQALAARKERIINEVFTKVTGIPTATINYYKTIRPVIEKSASLLHSIEELDRGSLKYIETVRYVTDKFNNIYDPYNTDHVPTKIQYILQALRVYDLIEKNVEKFATPERGVDEIIESLVDRIKSGDFLKEFNKYKKALD